MPKLMAMQGLRTFFFTLRGVTKAVDDVSIELDEGESIALVGESGCGKSTVAFSVMRLIQKPGRIVEGKIFFRDRDLLRLTKKGMQEVRGKEISMVFQNPLSYLNPVMKVGDQVAEPFRRHQHMNKEDAREKAVERLADVGIPSPSRLAEYYPHQLSGGMRQRVLIAMALSCDPYLLIADEPTSSLDVTIQAQILSLIKKVKEERGTSLLLITHDFGVVADVSDRVYVMYAGKIVESADVFTLYEKPMHPYTIGLLDSILRVDEFTEEFHSIPGFVPSLTNPPNYCRFCPRCSEAKAICREQEPPLVRVGPKHMVSCWLFS